MQSFSFKSLLTYIGLFALTFIAGLSIVGSVSPAKENGFEFGRGHRMRDRKLEAELERMQELNDQLQQRLDALEEKMNTDSLKTVPGIPEIPAVPSVPAVPDNGAASGTSQKAAPVVPTLKQKAREQASF